MIVSQQPSNAAFPAKQRPEAIPTGGNPARERGEQGERLGVETRYDRHVGVTGAPSTAFGEEHEGHAEPSGQLEQPVLLAMVAPSLCAGQDRVVVGGHRTARLAGTEQLAVHGAQARDQTIGRSVRFEVGATATVLLGRVRESTVFVEAVRVAQVGDVLPCGAPPAAVDPLDRVGARRIGESGPGSGQLRERRTFRRFRVHRPGFGFDGSGSGDVEP